jgi:hypothetical protein
MSATQELSATLDNKLAAVVRDVEHSEAYQLVAHPDTDRHLVAAIVKWYLLEVFSFGPHVTEATFTAIGRFPKNRPDLMKPMVLHDLDEVDHGEMALGDYLRLGGDERFARQRRMSPASFALAATCRLLAERESPFCYLGYMYFFEVLTPHLTERARRLLAAKEFPAAARQFIDFHARADIGHGNALRALVLRVVGDYPEAAAAIAYGFDCFAQVYPLPILSTALQHATEEFAAGREVLRLNSKV